MLGQKKRGAKTSRSETVTVRIDPKLRYFAELAARKQRRTLSSFIECVIQEELKTFQFKEDDELTTAECMIHLWDVDEKERLMKLASYCPYLLTYPEEVLLKEIQQNRQAIEKSQARA